MRALKGEIKFSQPKTLRCMFFALLILLFFTFQLMKLMDFKSLAIFCLCKQTQKRLKVKREK